MSGEWRALACRQQGVWLRLVYVDLVSGDLPAGLVLSQLAYWSEGDRGKTIERNGHSWRPHPYSKWWEECRLGRRAAMRALDVLRGFGFIETAVWKFEGAPTVHVRLIESVLDAAVARLDDGHRSPSESDSTEPALSDSDSTETDFGKYRTSTLESTEPALWKVPNQHFPPISRMGKPEKQIGENPETGPRHLLPVGFDAFWIEYPETRRRNERDTRQTWQAARNGTMDCDILVGLRAWVAYWTAAGTEEEFIPYAAKWLKNRAWETAPPKISGRGQKPEQLDLVMTSFMAKENT